MSEAKEIRKLLKSIEEQGWRIAETKNGYRCYSPDGETIVHIHKTPSDQRWLGNTIRDLRKGGYDPDADA